MLKKHIYILADNDYYNISNIVSFSLEHFKDVQIEKHYFLWIKTSTKLLSIIQTIKEKPGLIMYNLLDASIRELLLQKCQEYNIPATSTISHVIKTLSDFLDQKAVTDLNHIDRLDTHYTKRIAAIEFSIAHDDGNNTNNLTGNDIIIIGVSRTSKTPTAMFLAFHGYKVANIPFISTETFPVDIELLKKSFVIGLTIDPHRLHLVRKDRLSNSNIGQNHYYNMDNINSELKEMKQLCKKVGCHTIDITQKSVEETSSHIIKIYKKYHKLN